MAAGKGYSAGTIFLQVVPSFRNFQQEVRRQAKAANKAFGEEMGKGGEEAGREHGDAFARGARRGNGRYADDLHRQIAKALAQLPKVKIDADSRPADAQLDLIRARLAALSDSDFTVHANVKEAELLLRNLREELRDIAIRNTDIDIIVNAGHAYEELKKIELQLDRLDHKRVRPKVDIDNDGGRGMSKVLSGLDANGNAFRGFSGMLLGAATLGPILVPILGAIAGGIVAIGAAALGAIAGLGVLMLAFNGIIKAYSAMGMAQKNAGKEAISNGKAIRNAAHAVRDAEEAVVRAREDAARATEDAARRVEGALRRQQDAERNLAKAQRDAQQAQEDLVQARIDAAERISELDRQARGGKLDERQGVIDVFDATVHNTNTQNDPGATNLEKEQAAIDLEQARLRLEDIRAKNKEIAAEQAKAKKDGVAGSEEVKTAEERLTEALQAVADAHRDVADAAEDSRRAEEDQARTAIDNARNIRDAQERLADAQANYRDALTSTGDIGSSSMRNLKSAMDALSPAGQRFVKFLFGLRPFFKELRTAAAEGFLPALQEGLDGVVKNHGPAFIKFVQSMSAALGRITTAIFQAFENPAWQSFFTQFAILAPQFLELWASIGGHMIGALAQMMLAFAPFALDMLKGLDNLAKHWEEWATTLSKNPEFQAFLAWLHENGPLVVKFFGQLVAALVNLGKAIAPYATSLLKFFTGFLGFVAHMDPRVLGALVLAIVALVAAMQILFGLVAFVAQIGTLIGILEGLEAATVAAIGAFLFWVVVIAAVVAAFIILYKNSETFRDIVKGVMQVVGAIVSWLWNKVLKPIFGFIVGYLRFMWNVWSAIFSLIFHIVGWLFGKIGELWHAFASTGAGKAIIGFWTDNVVPAWNAAVGVLQSVWNAILDIFKGGIRFVVDTVINDGFIAAFNAIAGFFHSKKIKPIQLPASFYGFSGEHAKAPVPGAGHMNETFATGGEVGGYSPTATSDNIPAWLTAGEYVLPVAAVKKLRALYGDDFLEALRRGDMPGFSTGGDVLKKIGGGAKSLAGNAWHLAKKPFDWLKDKVRGTYGMLHDSDFGHMMIDSAESMIGMGLHALGGVVTPGHADGGPVLYDSGGWLQPGMTTVVNASGRPEPVLTSQQWDMVQAGSEGGGDTYPISVLNGPSANEIAEEIMFAKRHAQRGGKYQRRAA